MNVAPAPVMSAACADAAPITLARPAATKRDLIELNTRDSSHEKADRLCADAALFRPAQLQNDERFVTERFRRQPGDRSPKANIQAIQRFASQTSMARI